MKIGIFTDSHYCMRETLCGTRKPSLSLGKIKEMLGKFKNVGVDLCICLGDIVDKCKTKAEAEENLSEIMSEINLSGIQSIILQGNHDCENFSAHEFSCIVSNPTPPFTLEIENYMLVFLDANYRSDGRSFYEAGVEWTDSNLPQSQVEFLKNSLYKSTKRCIVVLHENLDATIDKDHIVKNAAEVRKIILDSKKVDLVLQGHYHIGADSVIDGTRYLTVPAMCEGYENHFVILTLNEYGVSVYAN